MSDTNGLSSAFVSRSVRNIRSELEFLVEVDALSQQQLNSILAQLPSEASLNTPASNRRRSVSPAVVNAPTRTEPTPLSEKQQMMQNAPVSPLPPYPGAPATGPARLCEATALYAYSGPDPGDLALLPNDKIDVHEYVNQDWWRGQSQRTKQIGIFPRNYVQQGPQETNAPFAQQPDFNRENSDQSPNGQPNKMQEQGKKMGKKIGNAALFGAGATIGSKIVNGIF